MPVKGDGVSERKSSANDAACATATAEFLDELGQPLVAASNYVGAARILLGSGNAVPAQAVDLLEKAEIQILRTGEIARHFRRAMGTDGVCH